MKTGGVLLLSHVGFSFLDDLIAILKARNLQSFVLSSLPLADLREQRLDSLGKMASWLSCTDAHVLSISDVDTALATLSAKGENVLACISVWEGYRGLMAHANAALGVPDLDPQRVERLRDKLVVRNQLADAGLSAVSAQALTPERLAALKLSDKRYFIKPRCGIASYGAFPLRPDTEWRALERIIEESAEDIVYQSAFNGGLSFLVEDYLAGREFSFEVIAVDGRSEVVAIHEKCEVTEAAGTVLENACTSPPYTLGRGHCAGGIAWIRRVLETLALRWGCFHIEARFDGRRWDLIEVNPRVGGSLISHSVKALNGQFSMLELWLDALLAGASGSDERLRAYQTQLSGLAFAADGSPATRAATFFRVYFAEPGRIESIHRPPLTRQPAVTHILLKAGDEVVSAAREVFLGQMLWQLSVAERDAEFDALDRLSQDAIEVRYAAAPAATDDAARAFLIVDYNLTRVDDVSHIAHYVRQRYGARIILIRARPSTRDHEICDGVVDLDPLHADFVEHAVHQLQPWAPQLVAGIVFSDNAVHSGAQLLERLGLSVDSALLAPAAFSKYRHRLSEAHYRALFDAQRVMVPECAAVNTAADLQQFAARHPNGFVVKPACEGNNRGVVVVRAGDNMEAAFDEAAPYLAGGIICEQLIPYQREYSYDGLGALSFITEKVSATGRYPVEIAQVLPARLNNAERASLVRAGRLANLLVGQCDGPFHNEIKLSDDGKRAAVVEPNRRPAGMKIWSLARWVYGVDLYQRWVDSVFGAGIDATLPEPGCSAATVMLGVGRDQSFAPQDINLSCEPLAEALALTAEAHSLTQDALQIAEFGWLSTQRRMIHAVPRDNADFVAYVCILLTGDQVDIRDVIATLRQHWLATLQRSCEHDAAPRALIREMHAQTTEA